jgi:hypothetical protein
MVCFPRESPERLKLAPVPMTPSFWELQTNVPETFPVSGSVAVAVNVIRALSPKVEPAAGEKITTMGGVGGSVVVVVVDDVLVVGVVVDEVLVVGVVDVVEVEGGDVVDVVV